MKSKPLGELINEAFGVTDEEAFYLGANGIPYMMSPQRQVKDEGKGKAQPVLSTIFSSQQQKIIEDRYRDLKRNPTENTKGLISALESIAEDIGG